MIRKGKFNARDLRIVESGSVEWPLLKMGEACTLNSGGPRCLVVDLIETDVENLVTIAAPDGSEITLSRVCLRRL